MPHLTAVGTSGLAPFPVSCGAWNVGTYGTFSPISDRGVIRKGFKRPSGTRLLSFIYPALKRRDIFICPSGTFDPVISVPFVAVSAACTLIQFPARDLPRQQKIKGAGHGCSCQVSPCVFDIPSKSKLYGSLIKQAEARDIGFFKDPALHERVCAH